MLVDTPAVAVTTEAMIYSNSPISQLLNFRIEYAGSVYPFQPYTYNFDSTQYNTNAPYLSNSTYRSFYDMCNFSDGLRDRSGTLHTADTYVVSPLIIFKTHQLPDNDDNTCLISLDFKNTIIGANLLVTGFYDETINLMYDANGKYEKFQIS